MTLDLISVRSKIFDYEKKINRYVEVENNQDIDKILSNNTQPVILKYVANCNGPRNSGDKPITLIYANGIELTEMAKLKYNDDSKDPNYFLNKHDDVLFLIDRRPFSEDKSIWKIAYIQFPYQSFVVVYDILKDNFDYFYCNSNDAVSIAECQLIMDIKLKQDIEQFCEENLILNLTPEYKQFMKKVYNGQITLED